MLSSSGSAVNNTVQENLLDYGCCYINSLALPVVYFTYSPTVKTVELRRHNSTRPRPLGLTFTHILQKKIHEGKFLHHDEIVSKNLTVWYATRNNTSDIFSDSTLWFWPFFCRNSTVFTVVYISWAIWMKAKSNR